MACQQLSEREYAIEIGKIVVFRLYLTPNPLLGV